MRSFYETKRATKETTIAEPYDAIENNKNIVNIVVLPPINGDLGSKESDCEDVISDTKEMFEPAGEIKTEEKIDSDDDLEMSLSPPKRNHKNMYQNGRRALV